MASDQDKSSPRHAFGRGPGVDPGENLGPGLTARRDDVIISTVLFFLFFGLYLHTAAPHVAPYRDAGEMVVLGTTLGVAHPPGYPLYSLLANIWRSVPLGNAAYRMNIFSGLAAAGAVMLMFFLLRVWMGKIPAVLGACALGLSTIFWELALVSEMYSLGALMVLAVLLAMYRLRSALLAAFLFALALGVRMDLLLLSPLLVYWAWTEKKLGEWKSWVLSFGLGVSIFLYMMIRSHQDPMLDWGNPDHIKALLNSMSRKSYASTLDLLSLNYKRGENFGVNMVLYGKHLLQSFSIVGLLLAAIGTRKTPLLLVVAFIISGPLFLFMANMPPNPHAVAIIDASYLLPDIFVAAFIGFGLMTLVERRWVFRIAAAFAVVALFVQLPLAYGRVNKRDNFYSQDYVTNLFRSSPKGAVVVLHKDVQIFSTWVAQAVDGKRLDLSVVPVGLSGSQWYWDMKKRWATAPMPPVTLKALENFDQLKNMGRPVVAGFDVEASPVEIRWFVRPELCVTRGVYRYGETPDFFSTDLIGDFAKAHHARGLQAMNAGRPAEADWFYARAGALDPTMPRAPSDRGYLAYTKGNFLLARLYQERAVGLYQSMLDKAQSYKALPEVVRSIEGDLSSASLNLGASCEKSGDVEAARRNYAAAYAVYPNAQAYYNMAVTYWGKEWPRVIENLEACLRINPQFPDGVKYLQVARAKGAK